MSARSRAAAAAVARERADAVSLARETVNTRSHAGRSRPWRAGAQSVTVGIATIKITVASISRI